MVSEKKMINEIVDDDDDDEDDADGRRIIPIALGLSAGGLKIVPFPVDLPGELFTPYWKYFFAIFKKKIFFLLL